MGGTAKRTEEMGYEKLKPCPGCASLQRPVVSPLGAWGLTVPIHAYITFLDLDFGLEAAQEAECSKVRDGWRYELSVGKENVHIHCELQDSEKFHLENVEITDHVCMVLALAW